MFYLLFVGRRGYHYSVLDHSEAVQVFLPVHFSHPSTMVDRDVDAVLWGTKLIFTYVH